VNPPSSRSRTVAPRIIFTSILPILHERPFFSFRSVNESQGRGEFVVHLVFFFFLFFFLYVYSLVGRAAFFFFFLVVFFCSLIRLRAGRYIHHFGTAPHVEPGCKSR